MKKAYFMFFAVCAIVGMLAIVGCNKKEEIQWSVVTQTSSNITTNGAVLYGYVTNGNVSVEEQGFYYDVSSNMSSKKKVQASNSSSSFSTSVSGLNPSTTYYYCAYAKVNGEIKQGETLSFTTTELHSYTIINFDRGDFSEGPFVNNSTYPWVVTSDRYYEGSCSMKSGNGGYGSSESSIELTVEAPRVSFYVSLSSEATYDYYSFYIDGVEQDVISGSTEWAQRSYTLSSGSHTLKWSYTKDGSVNSGDDCVYIDRIVLGNE